MPRQPRLDYPGAFHHVMNRGANHQATFLNDGDRQLFLKIWSEAVSRFRIEVIAWSIMGNHFHVFVHSPDAQLSRTMQFVGRSYTQQFNHHHARDGALFRGRFHSIVIDSDVYFARVARYVELNPVAAGICSLDELEHYRWSSFKYHSKNASAPSWISTDHILRRFRTNENYVDFVKSGVPDAELNRFYHGRIRPGTALGSEEFVDRIVAKNPEFSGRLRPGIPEVTAEKIDTLILRLSGVDRCELISSAPGCSNPARAVASDLSRLLTDLPLAQIARRYGYSNTRSLTTTIRRARQADSTDSVRLLRQRVLHELQRDDTGRRLTNGE